MYTPNIFTNAKLKLRFLKDVKLANQRLKSHEYVLTESMLDTVFKNLEELLYKSKIHKLYKVDFDLIKKCIDSAKTKLKNRHVKAGEDLMTIIWDAIKEELTNEFVTKKQNTS